MITFIDMDGVLVDLVPAWLKIKGFEMPSQWPGGEYYLHKIFPISREDIWKGCDEEWWANLPKTGIANELLSFVECHSDEVYLVTNPVVEEGATGKILWIERNYPQHINRFMMGPCRYLLARNDRILIDDQDNNIDLFNQHGGRGILLPQPWNRYHNRKDDFKIRFLNCIEAHNIGARELNGKEWT